MAVRELLVSPDSYMERKVNKTSLRREIILVFVLGGFGAIGISYVATEALSAIEGSKARVRFQFIGFAIESIVGMVILWFGASILTHLIANRVYNGRGSFRRLLRASAWAFLPLGGGNLIKSAALIIAFQDVDFPSTLEGISPQEQAQNIIEPGMNNPVLTAGTVILFLTALYTGYLLSFAIKQSKNISQGEALKTAAVPIVLFIFYIAQGMV